MVKWIKCMTVHFSNQDVVINSSNHIESLHCVICWKYSKFQGLLDMPTVLSASRLFCTWKKNEQNCSTGSEKSFSCYSFLFHQKFQQNTFTGVINLERVELGEKSLNKQTNLCALLQIIFCPWAAKPLCTSLVPESPVLSYSVSTIVTMYLTNVLNSSEWF